jgi:hypothetical protein
MVFDLPSQFCGLDFPDLRLRRSHLKRAMARYSLSRRLAAALSYS